MRPKSQPADRRKKRRLTGSYVDSLPGSDRETPPFNRQKNVSKADEKKKEIWG